MLPAEVKKRILRSCQHPNTAIFKALVSNDLSTAAVYFCRLLEYCCEMEVTCDLETPTEESSKITFTIGPREPKSVDTLFSKSLGLASARLQSASMGFNLNAIVENLFRQTTEYERDALRYAEFFDEYDVDIFSCLLRHKYYKEAGLFLGTFAVSKYLETPKALVDFTADFEVYSQNPNAPLLFSAVYRECGTVIEFPPPRGKREIEFTLEGKTGKESCEELKLVIDKVVAGMQSQFK